MKVQSISTHDFYDCILTGWIRVNNTYYWIEMADYEATHVTYNVYDVPDRATKLKHLLAALDWRHMGTWHDTHVTGKPHYAWVYKDTIDDFYIKHPTDGPRLEPEDLKLIGTTDLETFFPNENFVYQAPGQKRASDR